MNAKYYNFGGIAVSHERLKKILDAAHSVTPDHLSVTVILIPFGDGGPEGDKRPASMASTGEVTKSTMSGIADQLSDDL